MAERSNASPLFKLPPELRNEIYQLLLCEPVERYPDMPFKHPPILAVCKQITREATGIFYSCNGFRVYLEPKSIISFTKCLRAMAPENARAITQMSISLDFTWLDRGGVHYRDKFPATLWSDVPRAIRQAGIRAQVIEVADVRWITAKGDEYAARWKAEMVAGLPGCDVEKWTEDEEPCSDGTEDADEDDGGYEYVFDG